MKLQEPYIPRTDLGFTDRRRSSRFELAFADEAEIESWERSERIDGLERGATATSDREPSR